MAKTRVYFDHSSTTKVHPEVLQTYIDLLQNQFANSESLYEEGVEVSRMLEKSRNAIAGTFGISSEEVIFTSGSSESNSTAIKGVAFACPTKKHIITTQIEHSSLLNSCRQLEHVFGYDVTYLPVDAYGVVSVQDVKDALRKDTAIVSIMHVNNETGSIQPIAEIKELIKKSSQAYFHSDITQSVGKCPIDLKEIDLASVSAHKLGGLKGSGLLIKKKHVPLVPLINGGEQEFGLRGGTSNALEHIVFAKTLRLALEEYKQNNSFITQLHDTLVKGLQEIPGVLLNSNEHCVSHIVNFSYEAIPSEVMQNALNERGYMVSSRSTCESKSNNPSYVLQAMGMSDTRANSCIRISLSSENTMDEINGFLKDLREVIERYGTV